MLALAFLVEAAHAQSRVFVAAQGIDSNPCTFALPCRTFQHAHDVVAAGGEIDVLDPAGYGVLTINKSISIQGHDFSGLTVPSGGIGIQINAGVGDAVNLRGLIIEGAGLGQTGITFSSGASLTIEECVVRNLTASGIVLAPATASMIVVSSSLVADNGGDGIRIAPPSGSSAIVNVLLNRVESYRNLAKGVNVSGVAMAGGEIDAIAVDSVAAYNDVGFYATANAAAFSLLGVFRSTAFRNGTYNVRADARGDIAVSQSHLGHYGLGPWLATASGQVFSYGDNYTNTVPPPTGTVSKQ